MGTTCPHVETSRPATLLSSLQLSAFLEPALHSCLTFIACSGCFIHHLRTSPKQSTNMFFLFRSLSAYLTLIICASYGTVASAILKIMGLNYAYGQWTTAKAFKYLGIYTMGIKFDILDNGEEILNSNRPAVFIVNHQTELDVLLLGWIWPKHCSVTAKKSLRNIPFLGWFMTLSGTVFIDRVDRSQAMKAFEGAATAMKEK